MTLVDSSFRNKLNQIFGEPWYLPVGITILVIVLLLAGIGIQVEGLYSLFDWVPEPVLMFLWRLGCIIIIIGLLIQNHRFERGVILVMVGCFLWLFSPKPTGIEAFVVICYEARMISFQAVRFRRALAATLVGGAVLGFFLIVVAPQYKYSKAQGVYSDFTAWLTDPLVLGFLSAGPIVVCISIGFFWQLGLSARRNLMRLRDLEDRAELAAVRERNRIAREMHDVIAHSLTVMIAQADGGKFAGKKNPDMALHALETIGEVGRKSLNEMRQLLNVLHENSNSDRQLETNPGIHGIEDLVRETRRAGAEVVYRVDGAPVTVSETLGLSIFRIVQETLTNALKHAGPGTILVHLIWGKEENSLHILVENELGLGLVNNQESGHGLVGIAERVRLHGGTVDWGIKESSKWFVNVELPLN